MEIVNNCDELLAHLYTAHDTCQYCCGGHIEFEGGLYEIGGFMPSLQHNALPNNLCIISPKFPRTMFVVESEDNTLNLYIYIGKFLCDQTLSVQGLPITIMEELIATIEGMW